MTRICSDSLERFQADIQRLNDAIGSPNLLWAVRAYEQQDAEPLHLAEMLSDAATELADWGSLAMIATRQAIEAARMGHIDEAVGRLAACHAYLAKIVHWFMVEAGSYAERRNISKLARRGSRPWTEWARGVENALERCPAEVAVAIQSLGECWFALATPEATGGMPRVIEQANRSGPNILVSINNPKPADPRPESKQRSAN
jgi:hypothetical protein